MNGSHSIGFGGFYPSLISALTLNVNKWLLITGFNNDLKINAIFGDISIVVFAFAMA